MNLNVLVFWRLVGEGIALAFCQAPQYEFRADERGWLVTAGEPYADFNCALVLPGSRAEETLLSYSEFFLERSLPFLVCILEETESLASLALDLDMRDLGQLPMMTYGRAEAPISPSGSMAAIRAAVTPNDFQGIANLNADCFGLPVESIGRVAPFEASPNPRLRSLIAIVGDEIVGSVTLSRFDGAFGISGLMTKQSIRRSGIASLLMAEVLAEARRDSDDPLFLVSTPVAKPLYDRLGFETIDQGHVWLGGGNCGE